MSAVTPAATEWQLPADVLTFAAKSQVQHYLDPLRDLLRRLFPTASRLRVFLEGDSEIADDWHIVFEVRVSPADVTDYLAATRPWYEEFPKICPDPFCIFRLSLLRVD